MRQRVLAALLLVLAVVAAYAPALRAGFVWDDDAYVVEEETLREEGGLRRIWFEPGATPQYYPLVFTSFWVESRLFGLDPFGYHLTNVLLHGLSAVLLWILLVRLRIPGAFAAAAVFALHPVHVESVAWITERKNVLSGVFYLLALHAWLRFDPLEEDRPASPPDLRRYGALGLSFACFALALFAKTVTCSLPAAILLLVWWRRGRVAWADALPLVPFFALGALLARTTARLEAELVGGGMFDLGLTGPDRIVLAGRAAWFYLGKLLWPAELVFIYPRWVVDAEALWQWVFPLAALAALAALWALRERIGRGPLVAALFFGGTLVPALGFVDVFPMTYSFVADHFQYLASLGPIVLLAALGRRALARFGRPAVAAVTALLLALLAGLTWRQTHAYHDLETLWRDVLAKNDDAAMAHINLGNLLSDREQYEEAIEHYRAVFEVDPPERDTFVRARAHYNIGNQLVALARTEEAEREYDAALAIEPRYVNAYYGRGHARMTLGRYEEALADFETTLRLDPSHPNALQAANYVKARIRR